MKLLWSPLSRTQLIEAFAYLAERNIDAAAELLERVRVEERAESLMEFPELGPPGREPGTRELTITRTEYVLVYRIKVEAIEVIAVWHGKQSRK
jgi:plasmid stabilization system protein ParE